MQNFGKDLNYFSLKKINRRPSSYSNIANCRISIKDNVRHTTMMAPNLHLLQRLEAIQAALQAQRAGGSGLPSSVAGSERETFLREFLQKVFPAHRRFSTGVITDSSGRLSGQVDIAVEYGTIPSFPMPATEQRLLLAESVALVIEVKSDLVSQWSEVESTTRKLRMLSRDFGPMRVYGSYPPRHVPLVAVGYAGQKTTDALRGRLEATLVECRPAAALVIESGCWVGYGRHAAGPSGLYEMCLSINELLHQILSSHPNLQAYAQGSRDA